MKLSIIIPVYNAAGTVCKTLDSIYSQGLDMKDFEVICVDDWPSHVDLKALGKRSKEIEHDFNPENTAKNIMRAVKSVDCKEK